MERADDSQSNFKTVPAAHFRAIIQQKFFIQNPIEFQVAASVQKSQVADIQKIPRYNYNSTMDGLPPLSDDTYPTWIIRRHLTQNDSSAEETIEEYERIIGMHQQQHRNIACNGENTVINRGTSPNDEAFEKFTEEQSGHKEMKTTVRYLKGDDGECTKRAVQTSDGWQQSGDDVRNKDRATANEKAEVDNHRICTIRKEQEDMLQKPSGQTAINVLEGTTTSISSSNNIERVFSKIGDPQISRRMAGRDDCQKRSIIDENGKNTSINNATSKLPFHSKQPDPLEISAIRSIAINMKQKPIQTLLSHKMEDIEDEYDPFEEEPQPDWVTSSFRLGSVRRKKNEKIVAMQRIQKEIELEKQRYHEMIRMRQNNKITLC
ncbi:unnamed protein product [Litomosoides sigmodontis]|uniref:Uncharacterized protein n=1 Tax=Litomosoides sigmodontis TaxID=42156 RepID=A0A3P6TRC8_LITSI|nr:unnamed protein product [Litomosoides sigmodontis]